MDVSVNWLAVVVSAIVYFLLGWLWYSPVLFAKPWIKASGINPAKVGKDKAKMMRGMALSFVTGIVMAAALAAVLRGVHADGISPGIQWALAAGIGFVAMAVGTNYLFEGKSLKLFFINAGYPVAGYVVMAVILTLWK